MPARPVRLADPSAPHPDFGALRVELGVPEGFPAAVAEEARAVASRGPVEGAARRDATALPLVTIDPAGSRDLDQALFIERRSGGGFRVWYAIADVAAWVVPGGAIDAEAWARGTTLYSPDGRSPLHPPVLSEGAASLLPDGDRPALLWRVDLDSGGERVDVGLERALVRSRAQLSYAEAASETARGEELFGLLAEVGRLRIEREAARGGVSLRVPEQEVVPSGDGSGWALEYRAPLPVEDHNAQISLLCGMAGADLMLAAGVGLLRVVPDPEPRAVAALRQTVGALGAAWPEAMAYPDFVRSLDPSVPAHAAVLRAAAGLTRGAAYVALGGGGVERPAVVRHAALAAEYAHVTAPLRRLADRYAGEAALAAAAGVAPPEWVLAALERLPAVMAAADRRAHALDRAVVDLVEAAVLAGREGSVFDGVVVDAEGARGTVQLREPAVRGRIDGAGLPVGEAVRVRLVSADVGARTVRFALA
ncbi:MAG TPA: RNB domain-containing ribonuclease [Solirubrobacteraceae bacterium]|jgi:exoribonuclease R